MDSMIAVTPKIEYKMQNYTVLHAQMQKEKAKIKILLINNQTSQSIKIYPCITTFAVKFLLL